MVDASTLDGINKSIPGNTLPKDPFAIPDKRVPKKAVLLVPGGTLLKISLIAILTLFIIAGFLIFCLAVLIILVTSLFSVSAPFGILPL